MAVILWDDAVRLALQGVCSDPRCCGVWAAVCGSTHGAGLCVGVRMGLGCVWEYAWGWARSPAARLRVRVGFGPGPGAGSGQSGSGSGSGQVQGAYSKVEAAAVRTWPARHRWSRDRSAPRLESSERQCSICRLVASSSSSCCTSGKGAALPLGGLAEAMAATLPMAARAKPCQPGAGEGSADLFALKNAARPRRRWGGECGPFARV
eukprot:scaffold74790_cov49-Phaeocystis_antarctica.AAC.2